MYRAATSFLLIVLGYAAGFSQQRPLLTDDIDITPSGAVELGVGIEFQQDAKFPLSGLRGDLTASASFGLGLRSRRPGYDLTQRACLD